MTAEYETHGGWRFEVAPRELAGPLVPGRAPGRGFTYLVLTPAVVMLGGFLVAPIGWTLVELVRSLPDSLAVLDASALATYLRTTVWVFAVGGGVIGAGLLLAQATMRQWRRHWAVMSIFLVMPFGVSALLAGAAFRMVFDPMPERGTLTGLAALAGLDPVWLGTGWTWLVLVSAFVWMWLGFSVSLFRAALDAIDRDPVRKAEIDGAPTYWERTKRQFSCIRPVMFIVTVAIVVAAARMFDLVLIAVPPSMQYEVDVVGVHWWRLTTIAADRGEPAMFALPLALILGLVAVLVTATVRPFQTDPGPPPPPRVEPGTPVGRLAAFLISVLFALPLLVLVATAFHGAQDAGAVPWWRIPLDLDLLADSFSQAATAGLWRSLGITAFVAAAATIMVVGAAVPVAALLAARTGRFSTVAVVALTGLAVMPVQMYALAIRDATAELGLAGSRIPLIFAHAAAGLPFAILVVRAALATAPAERIFDATSGLVSRAETARRIWDRAGRALVAVAVLEFVLVWNDFVITFLISGPGASPLTQVLWGEARQFSVASGTVAASAVVSAVIPVIILLATWRRFVVPGLTGGVLR